MQEKKMEFEKKIVDINTKIRRELCGKKNIVIRGGGIHTEKLLSLTCIIEYWNKVSIVDRRPYGTIGNKAVKGINEIQWEKVDAVIISSLIHQKEMENELFTNDSFNGTIIRLYDEQEVTQFFDLQKDDDFLTLDREKTWESAARKSKLGYADQAILQFDYEEFLKHKCLGEKNQIRHYYDVLFNLLKTIVQLEKKELCILDFGGGFGTVYIDLKYYLKNLNIKLKWIIVEQENIVDLCLREQNDTGIEYKKNLEEIDKKEKIDFALFGSCLQYLENYQDIIQKVMAFNPYRIAVLKTPVSDETFNTVQHVNSKGLFNHYTADYPCRVMQESELLSVFFNKYKLEDSEEDEFNAPNNNLGNHIVKWKGFFFEILY